MTHPRRSSPLRSRRASHVLVAGATALVAWAFAALPACDARVVDVGSHDASAASPSPAAVDAGLARSQYGCAEWIDAELYALREGACGGTCGSEPELPYALESKQGLIAATAGQWLYCDADNSEAKLGPDDAVGVEFSPGCRLYFLRKDKDGVTVRGAEAAYQARYDIHDPRPEGAPRRIDVHIDDATTITFDVVAYRCPERLRLLAPGRRLELAPGFVDAGRPDPTR